ncbi:MAG: homoserine O-acetyltransferase [Phycisphaerae bacterium]|nr:homoserine O-acetyltransferase [Saprospiraceae bacterium]
MPDSLTDSPHNYPLPIPIPGLQFFRNPEPFPLENGGLLPELTLGYHTFGTLNAERSNVIWVCHALTANSDVSDWWSGLFGPGNVFDPEKYFIVCANMIGSCYGSIGPRSVNPATGKTYGTDFPLVSIRDIARSQYLLRQYLGIESIALCIGGSCGGHQVLELAFLIPEKIKKIALLVCAARESAWAIAIHESQRMAIEADPTWTNDEDNSGQAGLRAARAIGLLSYRTIEAYRDTQTDTDERSDGFSASGFMKYQGEKLVRRFYSQCYWQLTKILDTHNVGRGRGGIPAALKQLTMPAFVFSIQKDLLIPPFEQEMLAEHLPAAQFFSFDSKFGHDGFLIETDVLQEQLGAFIYRPYP